MGTSKAYGQAGNGGVLGRSGCMRNLNLGSEGCAVSLYPVQDDADAPGKGDHGPFRATTARDLHCPFSQPRRAATEMSRSPDWLREGVRPTHGPTFIDDMNREGSSTAER